LEQSIARQKIISKNLPAKDLYDKPLPGGGTAQLPASLAKHPDGSDRDNFAYQPDFIDADGKKKPRFHTGVDIPMPSGTPLRPTRTAVVTSVENNKNSNCIKCGYGNYAELLDDQGQTTLYAHTTYSPLKKGQIVTKNDIAAYSGNTGHSIGPHLHFERRIGGRPVSPAGTDSTINFNTQTAGVGPVQGPRTSDGKFFSQ
jgi:murein DD-endopeptidase MepM/ murein hydrolase activator NlpD